MVVSEITDKLSPNTAPPITAAIHIADEIPVFSLTPTAMGASAAMVPIDVPMEIEIKQPITNKPATANLAGINDNPKFTVLSTPPAACTAPANAPAKIKIRHIIIIFSSPAPFAMMLNFSSNVFFGFCTNATTSAIKNPTVIGIV